jgi:transcriptional regulator with XRE-family HTH domain
MLEEIRKLRLLIEQANVQTNVLGQLCGCSPSAITKYIRGISSPSGTKLLMIREGLKKYKEMIDEIIGG